MGMAGDVFNGVGLWMAERARKQDRDDAAVRSVFTAVNRTKTYLAARGRGEPIDRNAEAELVELWTTASVHIRRTDSDLAVRLQRKAEYWTNPENWTKEEVVSNGVQIDEISELAQRLLRTA